jgi:Pretoxin HINT domain
VGWVAAKDLNAGTHLQTKTESWLAINKVETHTGLTTVYNFEVAGFHTYFVSDLGLLVHNSCPTYPQPKSPLMGPPVTMDQAVDLATQHVGGTGKVVSSGSGGVQYVSNTVDSSGQAITKIARFDINPSSPHVQKFGPHLNLETQNAAGNTIRTGPMADPHLPISPNTIKLTDF